MLSSDGICGPTRSEKARYLSQLSTLCIDSFGHSPIRISSFHGLHTLHAHTKKKTNKQTNKKERDRKEERKKERKRKKCLNLRVSQLKQARLTSQFLPSTAGKLILPINFFSCLILLANSLLQCLASSFLLVRKRAHCISPQFILKSKECWLRLSLEAGVYTLAMNEKGFS